MTTEFTGSDIRQWTELVKDAPFEEVEYCHEQLHRLLSVIEHRLLETNLWPRGIQVVYIPDYADGPDHPAAEYGFVWTDKGKDVFCRFWYPWPSTELRTKLNSELCNRDKLQLYDRHDQAFVDLVVTELENGTYKVP